MLSATVAIHPCHFYYQQRRCFIVVVIPVDGDGITIIAIIGYPDGAVLLAHDDV
jgi:hypothetical protein